MSKVKIRTSAPHRFGKVNNISGITVTWDLQGECELEEIDAIKVLANNGDTITLVSGKITQKLVLSTEELEKENASLKQQISSLNEDKIKLEKLVEELRNKIIGFTKPNTSTTEPEKKDSKDDENSGDEDPLQALLGMKKADLIEVAKSSELPKGEWETLKVEELRSYLLEKLKK